MGHFDPDQTRGSYLTDNRFLLNFILETQYDSERPMGNVANSELGDVISASLVGLFQEISPIIPRAAEWLKKAIERDEEFGENQNFYRYELRQGTAVALWMRDGLNSTEDWDAARQALKASLAQGNAYRPGDISTGYLDDYMPLCYQAEQYEAGIAEYESYHGAKTLNMGKTLAPRKFAYALCLHEARQQFTAEELFQAGHNMLQAYLGEAWIDRGQFLVAAQWLKIIYWHRDRSLPLLETLLKAYDHMPYIQRPDTVQRGPLTRFDGEKKGKFNE